MSSFNFNRGLDNKVIKKNVSFATNPKINNNIFTINNSNNNLNLSVLTLNGSTVTADGSQLNYIDNATSGAGLANKVLMPDNNLDISNINNLSCDALIVNGNNITISNNNTASESNSPYLQKIKAGKIQNNKAIVVDNNRNIETINNLGINRLTLGDKKIIGSNNQYSKKKIHPITWSINSTTYPNNLTSIAWSDSLNLGVIVSSTGTGNRVMTSPDGITWTSRTSASDNNWTSVCWSPELNLFAAVANSGNFDNRIMTSTDGINWTNKTSPSYNPILIDSSMDHTIFLNTNNTILGTGGNSYGQQLSQSSSVPRLISNINNIYKIATGREFTLVLLNDGTIKSFGRNDYGQLGIGTTNTSANSTINTVSGINNAIDIACGDYHALALLSDGTIKAWGNNSFGNQLGDGSSTDRYSPVNVSGINNAIAISTQYRTCLALLSDGTVKQWGTNLGNIPIIVSNLSNVISISINGLALAVLSNGTVVSWSTPTSTKTTISGINNAISVSAGTDHYLVLLSNGTVMAWGRNNEGQLGNGTFVNNTTPTLISGLTNVSKIFAKWYQSYFILNDYSVKACGYNTSGQLGIGNYNNTNIITNVSINNNIQWSSICWSSELNLFTAVATSGFIQAMTSSDGITWISRITNSSNSWSSITWSKELNLFAAVSTSGSSNRVITSPDGITWSTRTTNNNNWTSICWSPSMFMFVAVASSGTNDRIMTSSDGITWTTRTSPANNNWISICPAKELNLLVAVASSGTNRIMFSSDGISWYLVRSSNIDANLDSIIWINALQKFIIISGNTLLYSNYITQTTNVMTTNNWYTLFNKINSSFTITQSGTDPNVELKLNANGTGGSETKLWYQQRIQDLSSFTVNFEIKLSGSADATSFNVGFNSTSFYGDGPNAPSVCLAFRLFSGSGTYLFINGTQVAYNANSNADNTWKAVQIIYTKGTTNTWVVNLNGSNLFTYSDANNASWITSSGDYFGFGSRTGGLTHDSFIRKFTLSSDLSVAQTITTVDSNIINTKIFNENINFNNKGKSYNALSNIHNLYPTKIINFAFTFWPYCSIWVKELSIYIIAGSGGNLSISSNGFSWTNYITGISTSIEDICWSPELNLLVAVSNVTTNNIITSPDGINWTIRTDVPSSFGNTWSGVCWSPSLSLFIAVGSATHATNRVMTSPNGINWTIRTGFNNNWQSVCWSPELSMLVAVGDSNSNRMYSYDGINWVLHNLNIGSTSSEAFRKICWSPELYLFAAVSNDRVIISQDGINWNYKTVNSNNWESICWAPELSLFLAVGSSGSNGRFMISTDGSNWNYISNVEFGWYSISWSSELKNFIAANYNNILTYNNPAYHEKSLYSNNNLTYLNNYNNYYDNEIYNNWNSYHSNINNEWTSICYSTDLALLVAISKTGINNRVMTSSDGITWTSQTSATDNDWTSICWASELNLFVVVASSGTGNRVMSSPDGITWTSQTSATDNDWTSICWSSELNLFVAVASSGTGNRVMTSSDGITWTSRTSAVDNNWTSICWSPELSLFVAVASSGTGNRVMTSSNGITWTSRTSAVDNNWTSICWSFYYNLFIAVASSGSGNRIMKSTDGINWNINNINYKPNSSITTSMKSIYTGTNISCAIIDDNGFKYWGANPNAQFGSGSARVSTPSYCYDNHSANGLWTNIKSITTANASVIVLLNNGKIQTRGSQYLGINTPNWGNSTFGVVNVPNIDNAIAIASGNNHVLALLSDGTIKAWGASYAGQLGNNTTTGSSTPINVSIINNAIDISAKHGGHHSLALLSNGTVMSWGLNTNGQLGNNSTTNSLIPILIDNLSNVIAISAGVNHSLALLSNGTIMAWGLNTSGQLGDGTNTQSNIPIQVLNINNAIAISAGSDHSLALLSNGTVMAWGDNTYGQLGDGTNINKSTPILISNLTNVNAISAGIYFSLVLLNNSTLRSWGRNNEAQLGNNTQVNSNIPITVYHGTSNTLGLRGVKLNTISDTSYINNNWNNIIWIPDTKVFVAISSSGTNRIIISNDGINWYNKPFTINNNWTSICWANLLGKIVGVSTNSTNNIILSNVVYRSLLSTIVSNGSRQLSIVNNNLVIGGSLSQFSMTINADTSNNILRLTNNGSNTNCVDFNANGSTTHQINIVNNSLNKITNIVNHNGSTYGFKLNNILVPTTASDLNKLEVTPGTGEASKVLVLDSNKNITNINNLSVNKLIVNNKIVLDSNDNNNSYLTDITPGIASASKLLVLDENKNISELNNISSNNVIINNNTSITNNLEKTVFDLNSSYFGNISNEFNYPSNLNCRTICWSPELQIFVAGGSSWYDGSSLGSYKNYSNHVINYSSDGLNWNSSLSYLDSISNNIYITSIAWSPSLSRFVAVYYSSFKVLYSSNGKRWNTITLNSSLFTSNWSSIIWANNLFVAVAESGTTSNQIMTSPDGITWTARTSPAANSWKSITYGNNLFVAVSNSGTGNRVMTSSNGISWTSRTSAADNNWTSVCWGNNLFVAVANSGTTNRVMTSPDGISWTIRTSASNANWTSVIWASNLNLFIASNNSTSENRIMTSSDAITWTLMTTTNTNIDYSCLCYSPELNLIVGGAPSSNNTAYYFNRMTYSNNAINWSLVDTNKDLVWHDLIYVHELGKYFAVSNAATNYATKYNKQLAISTNGIDWTFSYIDSNVNSYFRQICWSSELNTLIALYANAPSTTFYKSNDGIIWTSVTVPSGNWMGIKWISNLNLFIAIAWGGTNRVIKSSDGINWTVITMPSTGSNYNIEYSPSLNLIIITTTNNNVYYTSNDAITWTERTFIDQNGTSIWTSGESNITWISQLNLFIYTWNGSGTYYTSPNGINWTSRSFYISIGALTISFSLKTNLSKPVWINKLNKLYVIGYGERFSRIYESSNGINWTDIYSIPAPHNAYSNLYWANQTETLIAYGYETFRVPCQPFLVLNKFIDPIQNYNIRELNQLNIPNRNAAIESISTWISRSSSIDNNWTSICYSLDKNLFVAIANSGTNNRIMTSSDAITWTTRTSPSDSGWDSIVYSQELGLFVAIANSGANRIMTSSDGITWTTRSGINNDWNAICWAPELSLFVAVSSNGLEYSSISNNMTGNSSMSKVASASSRLSQDYPSDASTWDPWNAFDGTLNTGWHSRGSGTNTYNSNTGVYAGNVSTTDSVSTTHTGEWLQIQLPNTIILGSFIITGRSGYETERLPRSFVVLASNNGTTWDLIYTEPDKTNWSSSPVRFNINNPTTQYSYYRIVCKRLGNLNSGMSGAGSVQIMNLELLELSSSAGLNRIMLSSNGIDWENRNASNSNNWNAICWSSELSLFVAVANSGTGDRIMTSYDGITWTTRTNSVDNNWTSICWSSELSLFVAVANSGTSDRIMTSSDGINWTTQTNPIDNNWTSICWASEINTFISIANSGTGDRIMTSFDGINWTIRNNLINNDWTAICWSSGYNKAVAVSNSGTGNRVLTSTIALPYSKSPYFIAPNTFSINQVNGNVGLGTTSPNYQLELSTDSAAKPSTTFWSVSSDSRLKENIEDADLDLCYDNIKKLRLVKYTWKDELYYNSVKIINNTAKNDKSLPIIETIETTETTNETTETTNETTETTETTTETTNETTETTNETTETTETNIEDLIPSEESRTQLGWIADEVEEIFPKSVSKVKVYNYNDCKSLDSDQIIVSLFGVAKKLLIEYENQNQKINNLKNQIQNLENYINELDISLE
jgi:alpha-tubulin suppressor-like RCC1 family protein